MLRHTHAQKNNPWDIFFPSHCLNTCDQSNLAGDFCLVFLTGSVEGLFEEMAHAQQPNRMIEFNLLELSYRNRWEDWYVRFGRSPWLLKQKRTFDRRHNKNTADGGANRRIPNTLLCRSLNVKFHSTAFISHSARRKLLLEDRDAPPFPSPLSLVTDSMFGNAVKVRENLMRALKCETTYQKQTNEQTRRAAN